MNFQNFEQIFSSPRIGRYLSACGGDQNRAISLYVGNLKLSSVFHPLIGCLEVILRNQIYETLLKYFNDPNWITNQKNGFMSHPSLNYLNKKTGKIEVNDFLKREIQKTEDRLRQRGTVRTPGRIVSEQTLGFWVAFFEVHHYRILSGVPIQIFKHLPSGIGRKKVLEDLEYIRLFRNRINHNEPICFVQNQIDMHPAKAAYQAIQNILNWTDPQIWPLMQNIDNVLLEISAFNTI